MSSARRVRPISRAGFVMWAVAACTGLAMPARQEPQSPFCGRVLSLTCGTRTSDARMLLEAADGSVLDMWISAPLREDLMARLREGYQRRKVCVARDAAPGLTGGRIRLQHLGRLIVSDDPAPAAREDVFSTCDQAVQPPVSINHPAVRYTADAMRARVNGIVTLHGVVAADGHLDDIRVVRPLEEGLDVEATKTFSGWQFRPARRNGEAVAVAVTAEFAFQLSGAR